MVSGLGKPGPRAAKPITPPYVENNYRIEVEITFMLIAYVVLLCEVFWEFSIFHFCRPLVDIYWHPLLNDVTREKKNRNWLLNVCVCGHDLWVLPQTFTLFINPPKMLAKFSYPKRPQNILSSPPHHLKSEYLPFLTWVVITVCVPETRSIGLKKTNRAGLFKAGSR